jgi:Mg2+ and Co2+ transporter CorA
VPDELNDKEKIDLLEKEIDALEMSIRSLKKANEEANKNLAQFAEENQRMVDMLFTQANIIQDLRQRYVKAIRVKPRTFFEWLFGK